MKTKDFDKMQRNNIVGAIIGSIITIYGLTNYAFNKGTLNGASAILEKVNKTDKDVFAKVVKATTEE